MKNLENSKVIRVRAINNTTQDSTVEKPVETKVNVQEPEKDKNKNKSKVSSIEENGIDIKNK